MASWRENTQRQYKVYIAKWIRFCCERQYNPVRPNVKQILDFLTKCIVNLRYSAVKTCRPALSTFISIDFLPIGSHPLVTRFMKGVFSLKPSLPKKQCCLECEYSLGIPTYTINK